MSLTNLMYLTRQFEWMVWRMNIMAISSFVSTQIQMCFFADFANQVHNSC